MIDHLVSCAIIILLFVSICLREWICHICDSIIWVSELTRWLWNTLSHKTLLCVLLIKS